MSLETTVDALFGGALSIEQPTKGHRFGIDSVMLASFPVERTPEVIIDVGCGTAVMALIAARRFNLAQIIGLEVQEVMAGLARGNVERNNLTDRVKIIHQDVRQPLPESLGDLRAGLILMNPPYFPAHQGQLSPQESRAASRHEVFGALEELLTGCRRLLARQGVLRMIYPAESMVRAVLAANKRGFKVHRLRPIHSFAHQPARFVVLDLKLGGRRELIMEPPTVIYDAVGVYNAEIEAMLAHQA